MTTARFPLSALLAIAIGLSLSSVPAYAGKADKKLAKKHYKVGKKLYKKGKYKEALPELLEANRLDPNPTLVKNITKVYEKLDEVGKAAAYLQGIVDAQRPKKALKWAKKKLKSYEGALAEIKEKEMASAKESAAAEAKAKAEAEAKKREEELKAKQAEDDKARQEEESRRRTEHEKTRKEAIEANKAADEAADGKRIMAYAAGGLAVVAAGGGVMFGFQALSAQDEANKCAGDAETSGGSCSNSDYDSHVEDSKSAALLADISWVAFSAGAVGAVVLYLMAEGEKSAAPTIPPPYDELGASEESSDDAAKEDAEPKGETQPESKEDAGGEAMFFVAPTGFGLVGTF